MANRSTRVAALPSDDSPTRTRTRRALLEAALTQFADKGVDGVALHEIAAGAGVSNGTFYNYFRTRDELVAAASGLLALRFNEAVAAAYAGVRDPVERLSIGCRAFLLHADRDPTWGRAVLHVWGSSDFVGERAIENLLADLRAGKRAGRFSYKQERAAVDLVQGAVLAGMRSVLEGRVGPSHAEAVTLHVLRGLGVTERVAQATVGKRLPESLALPAPARRPE